MLVHSDASKNLKEIIFMSWEYTVNQLYLAAIKFGVWVKVDLFCALEISILRTTLKDVPGGIPKSDLLGVTVALIHVAGQSFLAV